MALTLTPTSTEWFPTMSDLTVGRVVFAPDHMGGLPEPFKFSDGKVHINAQAIPSAEAYQLAVKVKRLHPSALIPTYATDGSGCFDITALEQVECKDDTAVYRTGLAFEIPQGKAMILYGRSGYAFNRSLRLATCSSVIDSDFRGELLVKVRRDDGGIWYPSAGDRIAQAMIVDAHQVKFVEVDELSDTKRGTGGFGSTGA